MLRKGSRNIFIDLDGVAADFEAHYEFHFGKKVGRVTDEVWIKIHKKEEFFFNIPVMEGFREFLSDLKALGHEVTFLTASPKENYEYVAKQKRKWGDLHFPDTPMIVTWGGGTKYIFIQNKADILIDDTPYVCDKWEQHGGLPILHSGTNFKETMRKLQHAIDA